MKKIYFIVFILFVIIYALDIGTTIYSLHNYSEYLYEANPYAKIGFEKYGLKFGLYEFLFVGVTIFFMLNGFEKIENDLLINRLKIKNKSKINYFDIKMLKNNILAYCFSIAIILELYVVINNFSILWGVINL